MRRRLAAAVLALLLPLQAGAGPTEVASVSAPSDVASPTAPQEVPAQPAPCNPFGTEVWTAQETPAQAEAPPPVSLSALRLAPSDLAPKKRAWEESVGGREVARALIHARLAGWPSRLTVDPASLPAGDRAFLERVARDTWRGLDALRDRENGLPVDHVRFRGSPLDVSSADIGDYTSSSALGLYLVTIVAAHELGYLTQDEAVARLRQLLDTISQLETYRGILFNFYDTTSLERTSHFLSFVDSAWLTAGLMVVRNSFPELHETASRLIMQRNYGFFYDPAIQQMSHGFYVDSGKRSLYHYATLYTEARLGSLIAIGKGDVPEEHWYRMARTFPPECDWQGQTPKGREEKLVNGHTVVGGWYEWRGLRYVPSWGGSMFEALMPTLFLDERTYAPRSLGRNGEVHVEVQRRFALEVLGHPVWGMSPAASPDPDGYREYGAKPLGVRSYADAAVTPHAVALALPFAPAEATATLRELARRYPIYGEYGFYDSVNPTTGEVGTAYLALDQSMLLLALANHLRDGVIQHRFASDPIAAAALPLLADEDFFN